MKGKDVKNIKQLTKNINKIISNSKQKIKFRLKSWWNSTLRQALQDRNEARQIFNATRNITHAIDLRKKIAILKVKIKRAKIKQTEKKHSKY